MINSPIGTSFAIPFRLELAGVPILSKVGGGAAGNVNVKIADSASGTWDPLTVATHFTVTELGEGDYTITVLSGKIVLPGLLRIKIWDNNAEATFETKQYVANVNSIITSVLGDKVFYSNDSGSSGTLAPFGSAAKPVDILDDAVTIANAHKIKEVSVGLRGGGGESLTVNPSGLSFIGKNEGYDYTLANPILLEETTNGCIFRHLPVAWTESVSVAGTIFRDCMMGGISAVSLTKGFRDCLAESSVFLGKTQVYGSNNTLIQDSLFQEAELDIYGPAGQTMLIANCQGRLNISRLENCTVLLLNFNGVLTLGANCTSGKIVVTGRGAIDDSAIAGTETDFSAFVQSYGIDHQSGLLGAPVFVDRAATGTATGRDWKNAFLTVKDANDYVAASGKASIIYVMGSGTPYTETNLTVPDRSILVGVYNNAFAEIRGATTSNPVIELGDSAIANKIRFGCTSGSATFPIVKMNAGSEIVDSSFGGVASGQDFLIDMNNKNEQAIRRTELSGSGNAKNAIRGGSDNSTIEDNSFLDFTENHIVMAVNNDLNVITKNAFLSVATGFFAVLANKGFHRIVGNAHNGDGDFIAETVGGTDENIIQGNDPGLSEERMKEIIFNRSVTSRHANDKPRIMSIGPAGADGTVTTTIDTSGNMQTEILS